MKVDDFEKTAKTGVKAAGIAGGFLLGGCGGAFVGTLIFPGVGTAIGYLVGGSCGGYGGLKATEKMFDSKNKNDKDVA